MRHIPSLPLLASAASLAILVGVLPAADVNCTNLGVSNNASIGGGLGVQNIGVSNGVWATNFVHAGHDTMHMDNSRLYCTGVMHVAGEQQLYLLNKGGVIVSKAWGSNGNLTVEGNTAVAGGLTSNTMNTNTLGVNQSLSSNALGVNTIISAGGQIYSAQGFYTPGYVKSSYVGTARLQVRSDYWADKVFASDYKLAPLTEVETFIAKNGHLPGVPAESELREKGINVHDMMSIQMAKIEELTLHAIALEKSLKEQGALIKKQSILIDQLLKSSQGDQE